MQHDTSVTIDDNALKTQDIPSKLVSFDGNRLTLKVDNKFMFLWLKNNLLFSKKLRFFFSRQPNRIGNFGYDRCELFDNSSYTIKTSLIQ